MFQKSLIILVCFLFSLLSFVPVFASCRWDESSVGSSLDDCIPKGSITVSSDDYRMSSGVKEKIVKITNQIILAGSVLSVGAIVFSAVLYTTAFGDDDKIKKAKNSLKFAVMWFIIMLISFPLVNAVINLIYSVGQ